MMSNRARAVALLASCFIVAAPVLWVWRSRPKTDQLTATIQRIGFYPVNPPNRLRGPGTIYHISSDGKWTSALCTVGDERLKSVLRISLTEKTVSEELKRASIGVEADLLARATTRAEAELLQKVSYSLDDVQVYEVSLEELANIATELQERKSCTDQILQYLRAGDYVCQGQQVLLATASYTATIDDGATTSASMSAEELKNVIQAHVDPKARVTGTLKVGGEGLYYGMKLAPRCLALPGEVNKRSPHTWADRMMNRLGWW
jgi:hypothetical protein